MGAAVREMGGVWWWKVVPGMSLEERRRFSDEGVVVRTDGLCLCGSHPGVVEVEGRVAARVWGSDGQPDAGGSVSDVVDEQWALRAEEITIVEVASVDGSVFDVEGNTTGAENCVRCVEGDESEADGAGR